MPLKTAYTTGHFQLMIDGAPTTAYLKSVEGGYVRAATVDEAVGSYFERIKHTSTVEIEPISFELGISGSEQVLQWIRQSWRQQASVRDGMIAHADFDLHVMLEHEFQRALITETTFPALDGSSKDAAYLKVKLQPELVTMRKLSKGPKLTGLGGVKQKRWLCSGFRLSIGGLDELQYTNKIESFTIKQGIKKLYTGSHRYPELLPTKLEFPNITGTIGLAHADRLLKWYQQYVVDGSLDPDAQLDGSLEYLAPDGDVLLRINLYEVGLSHLQLLPSSANQDQIKRVKYELFVGRMDIEPSNGFDK